MWSRNFIFNGSIHKVQSVLKDANRRRRGNTFNTSALVFSMCIFWRCSAVRFSLPARCRMCLSTFINNGSPVLLERSQILSRQISDRNLHHIITAADWLNEKFEIKLLADELYNFSHSWCQYGLLNCYRGRKLQHLIKLNGFQIFDYFTWNLGIFRLTLSSTPDTSFPFRPDTSGRPNFSRSGNRLASENS